MKWEIAKTHHGMMIREYLQKVHSFSKRLITSIKFDGGKISVNGIPQSVRYDLSAGDILMIQFPAEKKGYYMIPENIPLSIVYEDEDIIIINKRPFMATAPSPFNQTGTVANGLLAYYEINNIPYTVHPVTRLDKDTSGLLLIAKHRYSHSLLGSSQLAGRVHRKYKAVVEGHLLDKEGTINAPIGRKEGSIIERTVLKNGKEAITHYKVEAESEKYSFLDIELGTGRTHQIRVHFSYIGHPVAGDSLYGGRLNDINRHALHCDAIRFEHPTTKEMISFQLPLPNDMSKLI